MTLKLAVEVDFPFHYKLNFFLIRGNCGAQECKQKKKRNRRVKWQNCGKAGGRIE